MAKDSFEEMIEEEQRMTQRRGTFNEQTGSSVPPSSGLIKGTIAGIAVVIFFIAVVIGMIHFSKTDPPLCVACLGSLLLVFGLIALTQVKIDWDTWLVIIFPIVGLALTVLPIIDSVHKSRTGETIFTDRNICGMIAVVFFIAGVLMLIMPFVKRSCKLRVCTMTVTAKCASLDSRVAHSKRGGRHYVYAPKWEYTVDGKVYEHQEKQYSNRGVPVVGSEYEILVNPDDPNDIYRHDHAGLKFILFLGAAFAVSGIVIFCTGSLGK